MSDSLLGKYKGVFPLSDDFGIDAFLKMEVKVANEKGEFEIHFNPTMAVKNGMEYGVVLFGLIAPSPGIRGGRIHSGEIIKKALGTTTIYYDKNQRRLIVKLMGFLDYSLYHAKIIYDIDENGNLLYNKKESDDEQQIQKLLNVWAETAKRRVGTDVTIFFSLGEKEFEGHSVKEKSKQKLTH